MPSMSGLAVDHQIEPRWLLDRQVGWIGALENLVHEGRSAPVKLEEAFAIAHHATGLCIFTLGEYGWKLAAEGKVNDPLPLRTEKRVGHHDNCPERNAELSLDVRVLTDPLGAQPVRARGTEAAVGRFA
jgi:hypothetical protein